MRGEIGKRGLFAFDRIWDNGFRQITTSTKPIQHARRLARASRSACRSARSGPACSGRSARRPTSINFNEVYSALQTRIVDGQENPLSLIDTAKLYEVQKYCSLTNHMWDGFWLLANRRMWDRLPPDAQEIVARELNAAALAERADVAKLNKDGRRTLEGKGLAFNDVEAAGFRDALRTAGFYKEWRGKYGEDAWRVLEESVGGVS